MAAPEDWRRDENEDRLMAESDTREPTPTVDEELAALQAVIEALLKLTSNDARARVVAHARLYLSIDTGRY